VRDGVRYLRLDVAERVARQREWNTPQPLPALGVGFGGLGLAAGGVVWHWRRRERRTLRELHRPSASGR
jgi:hypothetical protein